MTATLVLLELVSIAGLTARIGVLELLLGSTLPALFIGFLAGPSGLGYIDRALADGLGLGRDAAVAWLGLSTAVGLVMRVRREPSGGADRPALARAIAVLALGVFAAAALTALAARALDVTLTPGAIATLALVGAAVLLPFVATKVRSASRSTRRRSSRSPWRSPSARRATSPSPRWPLRPRACCSVSSGARSSSASPRGMFRRSRRRSCSRRAARSRPARPQGSWASPPA